MHLYGTDPELGDAIDFGAGIGNRPGKNPAKGDQAVWCRFTIARTPIVNLRGKADDLWSNVVDQPRALNPEAVEQPEKCFRIGGIALDIGVVLAPALDQFERRRLHHMVGHDVDVNIDDRLHEFSVALWNRISFVSESPQNGLRRRRHPNIRRRSGSKAITDFP